MTSNAPQTRDASGESSALLYRPALWVLYASLISIYLILRFVLIGERWPTRQDLQLELPRAAIGTTMLVISSLSILMARRAASFDQLRSTWQWLVLTLLLGVGFAIFQAIEFRSRWADNLIPAPLSNSLHDRADLYYLSAVQQRLIQLATEINTAKVRQNQLIEQLQNSTDEPGNRARLEAELGRLQDEESKRAERLAFINRLLIDEARWTSSVVSTIDDLKTQRMAIASLAYDIHHHQAFAESHQRFRQLESKRLEESQATAKASLVAAETSAKENSEPIKELLSAAAEVKTKQQALESQLKSHLRQRIIDEDREDAPEQEDDPKRVALERELAAVQEQLDERNAKLNAAAKLVTDAEDSASQLSQELRSIAARQATVVEIDSADVGLNQRFDWLRLPVCIPGGTAWAWMYLVLTVTHAIHLAYALISVLVLATVSRGGGDRKLKTEQIFRNWRGMVIVWVILFVLIYLI